MTQLPADTTTQPDTPADIEQVGQTLIAKRDPADVTIPATPEAFEEFLNTLSPAELKEFLTALAQSEPPKPEPFEGPTVVEIDVPSGRLVVADDLRSVPAFDIDSPISINYGSGLDAWARALAEAGVAYAFVGNSCPKISRLADGTVAAVSHEYDEELNKSVLADGEEPLTWVCTDLWAVMMVDHDRWTAAGGPTIAEANGPYAVEKFSTIDVPPGRYRWTVFSHSDRFDIHGDGRLEYAHLTLIDPA